MSKKTKDKAAYKTQVKSRAFELDFLRGIAIVMMVFMHFSYDIRYEFGIDAFSYLKAPWFWAFVHPVILVLFVGLSGICCSFSRNNFKRGLRLFAVSAAFTCVTYILTKARIVYCLIIFNVLHVLSIATLIYALISFIENKIKASPSKVTFLMIITGLWIMMTNNYLSLYDGLYSNMLLYPLGISVKSAPSTADFMPLIPWLGLFLVSAASGRMLYKDKKSLFPNASRRLRLMTRPLEFIGRHSLIIYLVHQPLIYGILYLIFLLSGPGVS